MEFYAAGNVILVNEEGICISVLRIVPEGEGRSETKVGALYSAPDGRENTIMDCMFTREMVTELLKTPLPAPGEEEGAEASAIPEQGVKSKSGQGKKYKKKKGDNSLKRFLSLKIAEFSPALIEHVLTVVVMNLETPAEEVLKDNILIEKVFQAFIEAQKVLQSLTNPIAKVNGYIIAKKRKSLPIQEEVKGKLKGKSLNRLAFGELDMILGEEDAEENSPEAKTDDEGYRYDGFHPFLPKQFCDSPHYKVINVEGYNDTVDKFVCPFPVLLRFINKFLFNSTLPSSHRNLLVVLKNAKFQRRKNLPPPDQSTSPESVPSSWFKHSMNGKLRRLKQILTKLRKLSPL